MSRRMPLLPIRARLFRVFPVFAFVCIGMAFSDGLPGWCADSPATSQLVIYHAGSLTAAFKSIEAAFVAEHPGITIVDKAYGAVDLARRVTTGGEAADIFATADDENIDVLLKPKYAAYNIRFGQSRMVLVYRSDDTNPAAKVDAIADSKATFDVAANPPSIPDAVPAWATYLAQPGVTIGGSDPAGDPSGYRALMVMQLAEKYYGKPGLYEALHRNYTFSAPAGSAAPDYRFVYESNALAMARSDAHVRLARLPAEVDLSDASKDELYAQATVTIPGLAKTDPPVTLKGERVTWGVTMMNGARNPANAIAFLRFLLTPDRGIALQWAAGPPPIVPAMVSKEDDGKLPAELRPLVAVQP